MKTTCIRLITLLGIGLGPTSWNTALADSATPASSEKTSSGIATELNAKEKSLFIKNIWGTHRFNISDDCQVSLQDKPVASLAELRVGEEVKVHYQVSQGVRIARQIEQRNLVFAGRVKSIDSTNGVLVVRERMFDKTFHVPDDCRVVLRDDKLGSASDIETGLPVKITYEIPAGVPTARIIAQKSATFTGTLTAVDMNDKTLKAKTLLGEKRFNLGAHCAIVLNGQSNAKLSDLKLGQTFVFKYDEVSGVNILNRIAESSESPPPATASSGQSSDASMHSSPSN